jgi:hypothetical protein
MFTYKLIKDSREGIVCGVSRSDGWSIPFDPANTDFAQFKKDLAGGAELQDAEGNVIDGIAYLSSLEK